MEEQYLLELYKSLRESQQKYIYFILAIDGSAIGFTIQFITSKDVTQSLWLLLIAVIFWGISFYLGCQYLLSMMKVFRLDIKSRKTFQSVTDVIDGENAKAVKFFNWMLKLLIGGTFVFIAWLIVCRYQHLIR